MKKWAMVAVCCMLVGCEYTTPLVTTSEIDIDTEFAGLWRETKDTGRPNELLILPWSNRQFLLSFPAGKNNAMFARVSLARTGEHHLAQLDWFGTARGLPPEDNRVYQYASYALTDDTLTVRLLNSAVVSKDVRTQAQLAEAIVANRDNPQLLREPMVFRRVEEE